MDAPDVIDSIAFIDQLVAQISTEAIAIRGSKSIDDRGSERENS
jgi:hypothetical protein